MPIRTEGQASVSFSLDLTAAVDRALQDVRNSAARQLQAAAERVAETAKAYAPVRTGDYRASIYSYRRVSADGESIAIGVGTDDPKARYVHLAGSKQYSWQTDIRKPMRAVAQVIAEEIAADLRAGG